MSYRRLILYFSLYFRNELNAISFEARIEIPRTFIRSRQKEKEHRITLKNHIEWLDDFQQLNRALELCHIDDWYCLHVYIS